eukprot:maker-scaffold324_size206069-snap-gene-1.38 protein:Tk12298 transcript:maker-scaffold324_size206069-snap-gene-1.38-mRNA-1 annotation:"hypothetical protein LOTGIDRAFT_189035"
MGLDGLFDVLEDFRLYCLSFWSDFYVLTHELAPGNVVSKVWNTYLIWFHQLPLISKIILVGSILFLVTVVVSKIFTKLTCGVCTSKAKLQGKTVLITGANSGIGYEAALDLARRGARVVLGCRNLDRGREAAQAIIKETQNRNVSVHVVDLSSKASVRRFAIEFLERERSLDILILNAGIALTKKYMTEDNFELHMASNHFGHFLLTNLLAPLMIQSAQRSKTPGRIVVVSSLAHWFGKIELDNLNSERSYDSSRIYGNTKLANLLFVKELARRLKSRNIVVNAVHPGAVQTGLFRNIPYFGPIIMFFIGLSQKSAQDIPVRSVDEGSHGYGRRVWELIRPSLDHDHVIGGPAGAHRSWYIGWSPIVGPHHRLSH